MILCKWDHCFICSDSQPTYRALSRILPLSVQLSFWTNTWCRSSHLSRILESQTCPLTRCSYRTAVQQSQRQLLVKTWNEGNDSHCLGTEHENYWFLKRSFNCSWWRKSEQWGSPLSREMILQGSELLTKVSLRHSTLLRGFGTSANSSNQVMKWKSRFPFMPHVP